MKRMLTWIALTLFCASCGDMPAPELAELDPADPQPEVAEPDGAAVDVVIPSGPYRTLSGPTTQVVYVNFEGPVVADCDCSDASTNRSLVIGHIFGRSSVDFAPYTNASGRQQILNNLEGFYADYNVRFTTTRPSSGAYSMIVISPTTGPHHGVAPQDCGNANQNDIAFVYSIGNTSADTISRYAAHELGHSFGLSHVASSADLMHWASAGRNFTVAPHDTAHDFGKCYAGNTQDAPALLRTAVGPALDVDGDTIPDKHDNCPFAANAAQVDSDANGVGDVCESFDGTFADDDDSPHQAAIEAIAARGITTGCAPAPAPRFCPTAPVTRGQMAAFLVRALGLPRAGSDYFSDDAGSIFEGPINSLAAAGITSGCAPGRFCPDAPVTRGQMAAFLDRAFGYPDVQVNAFDDDNGAFYETHANALAAAGITRGCGVRRYCGGEVVTREQMATFLARSLRLVP